MNANLEEAATIAAEYISSLDNLPNETHYLLAEIEHRDTRTQDILKDIHEEGARYVRRGNTVKPWNIRQNNAERHAELDQLAAEKIALAERLVQLVQRARARLDNDLSKVLVLQGEPAPDMQATYSFQSSRNPAERINESLRNAIAIPEAPPTPSVSSAPPQKKRRVATAASAGSIKLPSPAPMPASVYGTSQRSRLSQQTRQSPARARRVTASAGLDADEDAEGEDDVEMEEGGDAEDKELYCFCQKLSYGEMIACDNPNCHYQWFHLPCVNLKPPLPESWYCDECSATMRKGVAGGGGAGRKGRKK